MLPPLQIVLPVSGPHTQARIQTILDFLQRWNVLLMTEAKAKGKPFPRLTTDQAVYMNDPPGVELFQPADVLLFTKRGNCKSFAAYEAAWWNVNGYPRARAIVEPSRVGWHCPVLVTPPGGRVDPSKRLGM